MIQMDIIQSVIDRIREKYVPDGRVELFDLKVIHEQERPVLYGETTSRDAYREILSETAGIATRIRLLPDEVVGENLWGVIYNPVEKLQASNSHASEVLSEILLGTPVRLLDVKGGWRRVQTPDGYIGWVSEGLKPMSGTEWRDFNRRQKVIVTAIYGFAYENPDHLSQTVSSLVIGNQLLLTGETDQFYRVAYPDGREGYIRKSDAVLMSEWLQESDLTPDTLVATAMRFMGVPYVWGGTSSTGLDCSGLTRLVSLLHGLIIPRDASQQVLIGIPVDHRSDFSGLHPGDLLFFGQDENKVVHVAIHIGEKRFIHASDYVRLASLDPVDPLYDSFNAGRYLCARRIVGQEERPGIDRILNHPFYQP
jgi:cell wall-associated NlpC family hydrolase